MNGLIYLGIGVLIGFLVLYLIIRPKVVSTQKLDEELEKQNASLKSNNQILKNNELELEKEISQLSGERNGILQNISDLKDQAETASQSFYNKSMELAAEQLDRSLEQAAADYQAKEDAYRNTFLEVQNDLASSIGTDIDQRLAELSGLQEKLERLRSIVEASVEASKRAEELEEQQDFYRLTLSDEDIMEIERLREVLPYLRDKEPLNKVIYKVYYEKPYTDLIGRVVGTATKTGIYKITNIQNNMCYVGQAANIAERWRQHIKRGVGAEAPTRNKLYPVMYKIGPENFTFEVIEECDRAHLDEREDFWQEYFKAKEYGYSIK